MNETGEAWYNLAGAENDVVLSTRIRFARNFVNFPFPLRFNCDDGERIQTLVFDAFSRIEHPERYQALSVKKLDALGKRILQERGVLTPSETGNPVAGIVVRTDGKLVCAVNAEDHVRLSCFGAGFDTEAVFTELKQVDDALQDIVQFAASVEFGYLTASLKNTGTGMKLSFFMHLPSLSFFNRDTRELTALIADTEKKGYKIVPCFGHALNYEDSFLPALGSCYEISSARCFTGSEAEQIEELKKTVYTFIEAERMSRRKIADNKPTALRDFVYKALAAVKDSRFLSERECLEMLFRIKWGIDTGVLEGLENSVLFSLVYRTKDAHIEFINRNQHFKFEADVNTSELQLMRLRSLIMQESLEQIGICA